MDSSRRDAVLAPFLGFSLLAWYLSAIGAVLPSLRDDLGGWASVYPLLPGAALLVWGVATVVTTASARGAVRSPRIVTGFVVLVGAMALTGLTAWPAISVAAAVVAATAAAQVNRALPARLALALPPGRLGPTMMRANAFASVAAIVAPLAVGASLAVGAGWLPGYVGPVAIGAVVIAVASSRVPDVAPVASGADPTTAEVVPPLRVWWRPCAVLAVAVMVEFSFSYFAVTYLDEERGLSAAAAAAGGAAWGLGMAAGRFRASARPPSPSIVPPALVILAGFVLFWAVPSSPASVLGLVVAGYGVAPLYPSRILSLMSLFPGAPHEGSKRAALAPGLALLFAPAVMASLRALTDVRTAYLAVPVMVAAMVILAGPAQRGATVLTTIS